MNTVEELKHLSEFLKERATQNRNEAIFYNTEYTKGTCNGYADAYELCAEWIDKILKGASNEEQSI